VLRRGRFWFVASLLALGVAAIYAQTRGHAFLNYDDDAYILANPLVTSGWTAATARGLFRPAAANWHPLTWLSHVVDWQLFGPWAGGHHLVSAALHAVNAVLLFGVLRAMTGAFWRSAAVAALFALHPLRVESVAWAAERKDVLSAFFWLAATGAHLRCARRPGAGRLVAVGGLFCLGLAAKPMLVTLPFVLLLLDWWPLGRARLPGDGKPTPGAWRWRALVLEKAPLFALAAAASIVTYRIQTGVAVPMVGPGWWTRMANAAVSSVAYLRSFVWPAELAFLYPYPSAGVSALQFAVAAGLLAALSTAAILLRRRSPWVPVGWFWYLGTLVPVIGLVQLGAQARADRYTYVTMIGIAAALVWTAAAALPPRRAPLAAAVFCALLVAYGWSAWRYTRVWRDSLTLMTYTAAATGGNYVALNNLGLALDALGRHAEAATAFERALRVKPDHCPAQYNLGLAFVRLGRAADALAPLTAAVGCYRAAGYRIDWVADALVNLGGVELLLGRATEAERHFREALGIAPRPAALAGLREARARLQPGARGDATP
jgi:hypothetical protein